jgi:hypothetical protein
MSVPVTTLDELRQHLAPVWRGAPALTPARSARPS